MMNIPLFVSVCILSCVFALAVLAYALDRLYGFTKAVKLRKIPVAIVAYAKPRPSLRATAENFADAQIKSFEWREISVWTTGSSVSKQLLLDACGSTSVGEFLAILGPSGAGKSTLLDVIAGRLTNLKATGQCLINNAQTSFQTLAANASFVAQVETFLPSLTVYETLSITANLRLPESLSRAQKAFLMEGTIDAMGLAKVQHTQVGGLLPGGLRVRGISGGEQRRLSIGCGLIGAPTLIFLDEPTSGLDSNAALVVTQCISNLCTNGNHIVTASIHQPRAAIWELFDRVALLSEGHTLYCGPTSEVVEWFCSSPTQVSYIPELHGTPCEWLSDLISVSFAEIRSSADAAKLGMQGFCLQDVKQVAARYRESLQFHSGSWEQVALQEQRNMSSLWNQYLVLNGRAVAAYTRNPANMAGRTIMAIFVAVFAGMVFMNPPGGMDGVAQSSAAIFMTLLIITLMPFAYMSLFVADKQFFREDPAQSLYRSSMYYLSIVGVNAIVSTINGVIIMLLVYAMLGLYADVKVVIVTTVLAALHSLISVQVLVCSAIIMPNQDLAFVLAVAYTCVCCFLSGYFVHINSLWTWLQGISYLTFFRYSISAILRLQYTGRNDDCGLSALVAGISAGVGENMPPPSGIAQGHWANMTRTASSTSSSMTDPCTTIMDSFGSVLQYGPCFGGLLAIFAILHVISAIGLARLSRRFS